MPIRLGTSAGGRPGGRLRSRCTAGITALAALVAASCGTTVSQQELAERGRADGSGDELSADGAVITEEEAAAAAAAGGSAATASGTSGGSAAGAGRATPTGARTGGTTATTTKKTGTSGARPGLIPAGQGARGVTDKTIEVGLWTFNSEQGNAVLATAGGDPSTFDPNFDPERAAKAVVEHVNANGGIAGRRVVPRILEVDVARLGTADGRSQEAQRACSYWTEDHKVFAFQMISSTDKEGLGCARDTGTLTMSDTLIQANAVLSESMFRTYRDVWYSPNFLIAERRERNMVEELLRAGFFAPGAKVGIFHHQKQGPKEGVERALLPALAALGVKVEMVRSYEDGVNAPWPTFAFEMSSTGVTHVIFAESEMSYWPALLAMRAAEDQLWFPKWGLGSDQTPYTLATFGPPRAQMRNVTGMAWNRIELPKADSPGSDTCIKIGTRAGQQGVGMYCEILFFLKHVLDRAPEVSLAGFEAAMAQVGDTYSSVGAIEGSTSFSPDRHDGPSRYRGFVFDERCDGDGNNCWKFTTPLLPLKP